MVQLEHLILFLSRERMTGVCHYTLLVLSAEHSPQGSVLGKPAFGQLATSTALGALVMVFLPLHFPGTLLGFDAARHALCRGYLDICSWQPCRQVR